MDGERQIDAYAATESIYDIGLVVGYPALICLALVPRAPPVGTVIETEVRSAGDPGADSPATASADPN